MITERPRTAADLEPNEVEDGLIVYQESTDRVHHLNPTAAVVFQLCDGRHDVDQIAALVGELFGLDRTPNDEVAMCITRFIEEGLVR